MSIEGVPEGWELVRIGNPLSTDVVINGLGEIDRGIGYSTSVMPIVRKIEKPKRYRPFANAEEFKPHRDRWWRYKHDTEDVYRPPRSFGDSEYHGFQWDDVLRDMVFDDGTPFGVEVEA